MCAVSNPCKNGGTCSNIPGGFKCTCDVKYTGRNCETGRLSEETRLIGQELICMERNGNCSYFYLKWFLWNGSRHWSFSSFNLFKQTRLSIKVDYRYRKTMQTEFFFTEVRRQWRMLLKKTRGTKHCEKHFFGLCLYCKRQASDPTLLYLVDRHKKKIRIRVCLRSLTRSMSYHLFRVF